MPVTNFKISMNEYMRLVAEDAKKAEEGTIYGKLLTDLSNFAAMMQEYFSVNEVGKTKILDDDDYKKLIDGYTALAKDCNDFLSADHDKNRLESKRVNMITKLSTCVGQDLRGLLNADRTKRLTLSDVMKESRTRIVDLMLMYGKEASNRKQEIDRQHYTIPNQRPKDKHCGKI